MPTMDAAGLLVKHVRSALNVPAITAHVPAARIVQDIAPADMKYPICVVRVIPRPIRNYLGSARCGERFWLEVTFTGPVENEATLRSLAREADILLDRSARIPAIAGEGTIDAVRGFRPISSTEIDDSDNRRIRRVGFVYQCEVTMEDDGLR